MTSLEAVSTHIPGVTVPVAEHLRRHGMPEQRIRAHERFFGFSEIPLDPGTGPADGLVSAVHAMDGFEERRRRVRYVIQARSMPVVAPYPVSPLQDVVRRLGLEEAHAFALTQHACASGLLAVELAGRLLASGGAPDALALILTGEKAFTSAARTIDDSGVMGEATSAVLVSARGDRDRVLGYATRTHGRFHEGAWMDPSLGEIFQRQYPELLAEVMTAAVAGAGLLLDDIALVLPHNVNRMSWRRVMRLLGVRDRDRLYLRNLAGCGHCFGADAFLNYRSAVRQGSLRRGDRYLMTAVGLGATFSAMVLEH